MIRKLQLSDYKFFCKEIKETWEYEKYIGTKEASLASIICFLEYLVDSNTAYVLEEDKNIVGVLMLKNNQKTIKKYFLKTIVKLMKIVIKLYKNGNVFLQMQFNEKKICEELYSEYNNDYNLKIVFIMTLNKYRGQGYGSVLYECILDYMKFNKLKKFYLFSDEWCNYGFYDKKGMEKVTSVKKDLIPSIKNAEFYMYEGYSEYQSKI